MTGWALAIPALPVGCVETADPAGLPAIEVYTGSAFGGTTSSRLTADDMLTLRTSGPVVENGPVESTRPTPGAFDRASAAILHLGPAAVEGSETSPQATSCRDYGSDLGQATPAIGGVVSVSVGCPDGNVTALMRAVIDAFATP